MKWLLWIVILLIVIGGGWYIWSSMSAPMQSQPSTTATSTVPADTYGMTEYIDHNGFTFWYPSALTVSASTTNDTTSFPGGTQVERLTIGQQGGTYIAVVQSPNSTITDEPNGHASPISQTKLFLDASSGQWMKAFPEGSQTGSGGATTTADASAHTVGSLLIFPSGARFDTNIIPLTNTEFLVIADGGGSSFTAQLAQTVAPTGAIVDPTILGNALQAESAAYAQMGQ